MLGKGTESRGGQVARTTDSVVRVFYAACGVTSFAKATCVADAKEKAPIPTRSGRSALPATPPYENCTETVGPAQAGR
jgi:hypothetical protein